MVAELKKIPKMCVIVYPYAMTDYLIIIIERSVLHEIHEKLCFRIFGKARVIKRKANVV